MNEIPQQPAGKDTCTNCDGPIHLANRALEEVWLHADNVEWCPLRAVPASRPWPEPVAS